ncbi:DUF2785 domain-containing protein [Lapidilactobacillus bayanensis]|uniref:DUF2785 domain-containing protein n=1 Tax=Lapidilactobacillus bayanensis TaxID=2485998 RepID=UPI000F7A9765|nr:DUF2785 domain-containing protein [Lapidilactobacillus bayanensis]
MTVTTIDKVRMQLNQLYKDFNRGLNFATLPDQMTDLYQSIVYAQRRTKVVPLTKGSVEELQTILKKVGQAVSQNNDDIEISDDELTLLLHNIGLLNENVRDRGIFFTISSLMNRGDLRPEQIWSSLQFLTQDEVLFAHILEPQNSAVFSRSMAVLLCSVFLVADRSYGGVLTDAQYWQVVSQLTLYTLLERDVRGFVPDAGWAHAYTHIGNVLAEVSESRLTRAQKLLFLTGAMVGYQQADQPFAFGEDQRMATATLALADKEKFYADYLIRIFQIWSKRTPANPQANGYDFWTKWYNRNHYFVNLMVMPDIPEALIDFIKKMPN